MKLYNEEQLLNVEFRKKVIDEIEGNENRKRKDEMKKRYDIYKDETKKYVIESMVKESTDSNIEEEIKNRASNISFGRKIIDKKAMVYKDSVQRTASKNQKQIDEIINFVNLNSKMKKTNKYAELFRNAVVSALPYKDPEELKYKYKLRVLQPYFFDVIEDQENPEIARCYITSYYNNQSKSLPYADENRAGYREGINVRRNAKNDGIDQIIADSPEDFGSDKKEYVWWSTKYHFTTDRKGDIIPGKQEEDLLNPINTIPFHNFSQDQDGQFWAKGGDDIIDASIVLNILLTDLFYISKYQGMGIGYMFGKGVPKKMKVGASAFVTLEMEEGDPNPQMGFATSNPPINAHLDMIEKYVAFILSTNNLEPGTVNGQLSAAGAASGIQEMIRRAENMDDIIDQREIYRDGEPVLFNIIAKWHNLYWDKGLLIEKLQNLGKIDEKINVSLKFGDPQPFTTEKERLEVIEKRLALGLDTMVDAILKDNPDLSKKEAEEKARLTMERKLKESSERLKAFQNNMINNKEGDDGESDIQTETE